MRQLTIGSHRVFKFSWRRALVLTLLALVIALFLVLSLPQRVHGAEQALLIHRNYDVTLRADGDLTVVEHWDLQIGTMPRRQETLQIYLAHMSGIDFGPVRGATDQSQRASRATDDAGNSVARLEWAYPETTNATRSFEIPYVIHGALGLTQDHVWLDWHFLAGEPILPTLQSLIRFTVPDAARSAVDVRATINGGVGTSNSDGNVTITGRPAVAGTPLEVLLALPRAAFPSLTNPPTWQTGSALPVIPSKPGGVAAAGIAVNGSGLTKPPASVPPRNAPHAPFPIGILLAVFFGFFIVAGAIILAVWRRASSLRLFSAKFGAP